MSRLPKGITIPNDTEYEIIEFVYEWHPSINSRGTGREGKKQIADLYIEFGMSVISDMLETACKAKSIITRYFETKRQLKELRNKAKSIDNLINETKSQIKNLEKGFEKLTGKSSIRR